jgi:mannose-6-phosphate isomerase-like protein (cupin superfamily)
MIRNAATTAADRAPGRCRMVRRAKSFVVNAGEGRDLRGPAGGDLRLKSDTDSTDGAFTLLEIEIGPKQGPPRHLHRREDEMWYVLDGSFRFFADDEILTASPGAFVFVPRGTSHCFQNLEDRMSRILVMFAPSGMERFFIEHAELPPGPADPDAYDAIAERSMMTVTGPTLAVSHPLVD